MRNRPKITDANVFFLIFVALFMFFQILITFIAAIVSINYGSEYLQNFALDNILIITSITEFGLILIPVIIFALAKKLNFKEVFRLHNPGIIPVILIILGAIPAYMVALMLNNTVAYFIQFIGELPRTSIPVPNTIPELLFNLFVFAVAPAICEEMMHRGILLSAYERRGSYRAVAITAILFGIFHFDIINLFGPIFLGALIGYYVIRTNSIFAGMLAHFLNNAIAIILSYFTSKIPVEDASAAITLDVLVYFIIAGIIGLAILAVIVVLFNTATKKRFREILPIADVSEDSTAILTHWPIITILALYVMLMATYLMAI